MQQQVKQERSETYNYTKSNQPTAPANDAFKVEVYELVGSLKFICLGLNFLDHLDPQIANPLLQTYGPKQTFNIKTFKYY